MDQYPSSQELRDAAVKAVTNPERDAAVKAVTNPERAARVRQLRVEEDESWRAIAETCHEEWGGGWELPSHQYVGMQLCRVAAEFFGEDGMAEPWN